MRNSTSFLFSVLACLCAASASPASDYARVSFSVREQAVVENAGETSISIQTSRGSTLPITVPFFIDRSASTALPASSSTASDGDYYITAESPFQWNATTEQGSVVIDPGQRSAQLKIKIIDNHQVGAAEKTIVFRLGTPTVARPVEPLAVTVRILDDDPIGVHFESINHSAVAGAAFNVSLFLSSPASQLIRTTFTLSSEDGFDREHASWPEGNVITIPATNSRASISLPTLRNSDPDSAPRTYELRLESAVLDDGTPLTIDSRKVTLTLIPANASKPLSVNIVHQAETAGISNAHRIPEYGGEALAVMINRTFTEEVIVPVTFSGTAIRGDHGANSDNFHYLTDLPEDGLLRIPAGRNSGVLNFSTGTRHRVLDERTIVMNIGTPRFRDGTELQAGGTVHEYTLTIEGQNQVTLSFGEIDPDADPDADDYEPFLPAKELIAARIDRTVAIPIFQSGIHGKLTTYKIEVVGEGTTARLYSPDAGDNWDFYIGNANQTPLRVELNKPIELSGLFIPIGQEVAYLRLYFNQPQVKKTTYPTIRQPDSDLTVRLRISAINTDESRVTPGEHMEFTVTIREFPDVEVTHFFPDLIPYNEQSLPVRNPRTGLHEVLLNFQPNHFFNDEEQEALRGYRSWKLVFAPAIFDPENPDAPTNDPRVRRYNNPSIEYLRIPQSPFRPRYPAVEAVDLLLKGQPRSGSDFLDINADTYSIEYQFFRRINLPLLNTHREGPVSYDSEINDPFQFHIDFANENQTTFDLSRLTREGAVRVYLSRGVPTEATPVLPVDTSNILQFHSQNDGSIFIEVENPEQRNLGVQYLDEDGTWRSVPSEFRNLGTRLIWIDRGPPYTHKHPKDAQFRVYRFFTTN